MKLVATITNIDPNMGTIEATSVIIDIPDENVPDSVKLHYKWKREAQCNCQPLYETLSYSVLEGS